MKMAVIVPSRGRPEAMAELLEECQNTCSGDTRIVCRVDDDDPELAGYRAAVPYHLYVGKRIGLGASINEMAADWVDKADVIGFMGDDHRPRTLHWDVRIMEQIKRDPFAVVYGNDLFQGHNLASQVFMGSELVRRLGFFNPPGIKHMYIDNFWMTLGTNLGTLTYLDDVWIEHMHPLAGKAKWDRGYRDVNSDERYAEDKAAFHRYCRDDLFNDLQRVVTS
jgi:hypothetical protein